MAGQRIRVPDLVGFGWEEAREMARAAGLRPRAVGPDDQAVNGKGGVVIGQKPAAGSRTAREADLALRVAFGGGPAGDKEPRNPLPEPQEFYDLGDLPPDWATPGSGPTEREPELVGGPAQ